MIVSALLGLVYSRIVKRQAEDVLAKSWIHGLAIALGGWAMTVSWGTPKWVFWLAVFLSILVVGLTTLIAVRSRQA